MGEDFEKLVFNEFAMKEIQPKANKNRAFYDEYDLLTIENIFVALSKIGNQ